VDNGKLKIILYDLISSAVDQSDATVVDVAVDRAVDKVIGAEVGTSVRKMQSYTNDMDADWEGLPKAYHGAMLHRLHGGSGIGASQP
jgi:hypothetical protein